MGKGRPGDMYAQHPGYPPQQGYAPPAPVLSQAQSTNVVVNTGGGSSRKVHREWSTQTCACFEDVGGCLCAICCTPCFLMTLATRMNEFCLLPFCVPQSLLAMRVKIRAENAIKGSICNDCVMTSCCPMLTACQMKRELDNIDRRKPGTEL